MCFRYAGRINTPIAFEQRTIKRMNSRVVLLHQMSTAAVQQAIGAKSPQPNFAEPKHNDQPTVIPFVSVAPENVISNTNVVPKALSPKNVPLRVNSVSKEDIKSKEMGLKVNDTIDLDAVPLVDGLSKVDVVPKMNVVPEIKFVPKDIRSKVYAVPKVDIQTKAGVTPKAEVWSKTDTTMQSIIATARRKEVFDQKSVSLSAQGRAIVNDDEPFGPFTSNDALDPIMAKVLGAYPMSKERNCGDACCDESFFEDANHPSKIFKADYVI